MRRMQTSFGIFCLGSQAVAASRSAVDCTVGSHPRFGRPNVLEVELQPLGVSPPKSTSITFPG
jgi:hypothetical protein